MKAKRELFEFFGSVSGLWLVRIQALASRQTRFARLGKLISRRPRTVLLIWVVLVAGLGVLGSGIEDKVTNRVLLADGSPSEQAHDIATREFGEHHAVVVLLQGPATLVEHQGRALAKRLSAMPGALAISPWESPESLRGLMPSPTKAAIVLVARTESKDQTAILGPLRAHIDETIVAPVRVSVAGGPPIAESFLSAANDAAKTGELIALPILLVVLLFVFRSVIAAMIPVVVGGAVVAATKGILELLSSITYIDSFALATVGMLGLALGVDYSLLIVSRFREESSRGFPPATAAQRTVAATGPTVVTAGAGISLALLVASQLLPSEAIGPSALAVIVASILSVLSALLVVPAILMVLGSRLEQWALPPSKRQRVIWGWTTKLAQRPRLVIVPIIAFMGVAALGTFGLDSEIGALGLLPPEDPGRRQQEDVQRALGPGWASPYEIFIEGEGSPITTPDRLRAFVEFQRTVEHDRGIAAVNGFAAIERATRGLDGVEGAMSAQEAGLGRLGRGLARVEKGTSLSATGLGSAAENAGRLDSALSETRNGTSALAAAARSAGGGSNRLLGGLQRASGGTGQVAAGAQKASAGAEQLSSGLARARDQMGAMTSSTRLLESAMNAGDQRLAELEKTIHKAESSLASVLTELASMTTGRSDPRYQAVLQAAEETSDALTGINPRTGEASTSSVGADVGVSRARGQFSVGRYLAESQAKSSKKANNGFQKIARSSARLNDGLAKLATSSRELSQGVADLSRGGEVLVPGLARVGEGVERVASGLGQLQNGAGHLAGALDGGAQKSILLTEALRKVNQGIDRQQESGDDLSLLRKEAPGMFRSGYFYLASLDGAPPNSRSKVEFLVNLERGGHTAQMLVIPNQTPAEAGSTETRQRLETAASKLARDTGTHVIVGGTSAAIFDLDSTFSHRSMIARIALTLVTMVVLIIVLRALIMPIIAALLNLLTVAVTFGILALVFNDSFLGGPGYLDTTIIPMSIVVIFALAIDYEIFLFGRMREEYVRTGSTSAAISNGIERTAPIITGAALIMIAVFLAFSTTSFSTIRNFGVAEAVAVAIDAFIVRLVLIPAIMQMLGESAWRTPKWLDRLLPGDSRNAHALREDAK